MSLVKVLVATFIMILGQIGSFMQLQGAIKYGWYEKYMWVILLSSIPVSYLYIVAVHGNVYRFIQGTHDIKNCCLSESFLFDCFNSIVLEIIGIY